MAAAIFLAVGRKDLWIDCMCLFRCHFDPGSSQLTSLVVAIHVDLLHSAISLLFRSSCEHNPTGLALHRQSELSLASYYYFDSRSSIADLFLPLVDPLESELSWYLTFYCCVLSRARRDQMCPFLTHLASCQPSG